MHKTRLSSQQALYDVTVTDAAYLAQTWEQAMTWRSLFSILLLFAYTLLSFNAPAPQPLWSPADVKTFVS